MAQSDLLNKIAAIESNFFTSDGDDRDGARGFAGILNRLCRGVGIEGNASFQALSSVQSTIDGHVQELNRIRKDVEQKLRQDVCNNELADANRRVVRLCKLAYYSSQCVNLLYCVDEKLFRGGSDDSDFSTFCELVKPFQPCEEEDAEKLSKYQKMLLHVLRYAWQLGYRRSDDAVFEQVFVNDKPTGAWRRVCSLEELVYKATKRSDRFDQWINLTSAANNATAAAQYLRVCDDFEIPKIEKNRHVFAFSNGVYISRCNAFYAHGAVPQEYLGFAASKFFDAELPLDALDCEDWKDIATPSFQSILTHQEFDANDVGVDRWMYVMIGRLLYEVGEKDNWQVIPFLKGMAGSGKSTILLNVCKFLFDDADVGVLSNNIEKKFGLWGFCNKKMFIAPEIKTDLHLDQAEFQSLVSGDAMQVAQKHMQSETISWKVPGILAGNEVPAWKDASGSITRRILLFHFSKTVTEVDTQLGEKLRGEMPLLLVKCNRAYLKAVDAVGPRNIWTALPQYFRDTQRDLQACVDALWNFLSSGDLEFGEDLYMPWDTFQERFKEFCKSQNVPYANLNKTNADTYTRTLSNFHCVKESVRVERKYPRHSLLLGDKKVTFWVTGVDEPTPSVRSEGILF